DGVCGELAAVLEKSGLALRAEERRSRLTVDGRYHVAHGRANGERCAAARQGVYEAAPPRAVRRLRGPSHPAAADFAGAGAAAPSRADARRRAAGRLEPHRQGPEAHLSLMLTRAARYPKRFRAVVAPPVPAPPPRQWADELREAATGWAVWI